MIFFSKIDLLGVPATLNFFGNEKRKSNFGGICSVIFLVFLGWSIYNSSLDLVNRTNPKITLSEINVEDPKEVNISMNDFPVAFMVQGSPAYNNNTAFVDDSIYLIQAFHLVIERKQLPNGTYIRDVKKIPLTLERCTKEYFGEYASSFATFTFQGMYCISKNNTEQLKFQGLFTSTIFHGISGWVRTCNSADTNVTCKSQPEIEKAMSGSYFNVLYMDNMMNIQNYSYPTAKYRELYNTILNPESYKELNIDVGLMSITTDTGLFVEDTHTETTLTVKKTKELVDFNPSLLKTLIYFYLQGSRTETYYTRSYKKIPTIMAEVGSLANAFLGILIILISPYLRLKSKEALLNDFFDFEGKHGAQENTKPGKIQTSSSRSYTNKARIDQIQEDNTDKTDRADKAEKGLKGKSKLKDLRIATIAKTFTSEAMLSHDNFQTSPNELQESPQVKMDFKPQLTTEEDAIAQIWSPKGGAGQSLFLSASKKRQSNQYSQFALSPIVIDPPSTFRRRNSNTSRRLMSESFPVTKADGDKYEGKESEQMDDDIEKQLDNIDSPKLKGDTVNGEMLEVEEMKIGIPVDSDTGREDYKRSSTEQVKEKTADTIQGNEKTARGKAKKVASSCFSTDKQESTSNAELRIWEYMLSLVCKPKGLQKKITAIQEGVKYIEERLDLNVILKKFYEVDKLIALLLDRDQLELFNKMPKPKLKMWQMNHLQSQHTFEANLSTKLTSVKTMRNEAYMQRSYERVKQKAIKSDIDKRLIEIFKDDFI